MHVIGHTADRKNVVFVLLNDGDNVFIELVSPTVFDYKLPRDASLRDAKMIFVGFLPKEASLRDARIVRFQIELLAIILSWHEPPGFVLFLTYAVFPDKGVHAYNFLIDYHLIVIVFSSYYLTFIFFEV
jgi:hypothetical protein